MVSVIECKTKFIVEFGVENAKICNSRCLVKHSKWDYLLMDGDNHPDAFMEIKQEFITSDNINSLFEKHKVPKDIGILSVDIDYNTYWVLKAIDSSYKADIIVLEYNASMPINEALSVPENKTHMWDFTNYFGASLRAFTNLLEKSNYTLLYCDITGINAFYVHNHFKDRFVQRSFEEIFRPAGYGKKVNGRRQGHPQSTEQVVQV
jgi:hypothetical protein